MKKIIFICLAILISSIAKATENPHGELKYGCKSCHTVESFKDISFDHTLTGYELQNRHQTSECVGCHDISNFSKVKSNCLSCHTDIHQAKMGIDCSSCHTTRGWEQFDIQEMHLNTNFPFSGKHALVDCQGCHTNMPSGDFSFNTTRCISCHQSDYLAVNSPNHVNSGFATDCENCHQMDRWRPANFGNHDILFPIFSGEHNNEWDDCRDCHTDPSTYQIFNCLNCHEHPQAKTNSEHSGITGYVYNSPDCFFCHPQGKAEDFQDHDAQFFPIFSGVHNAEWSDCNECHINQTNRNDFSCYENCHAKPETDNVHGGMNGYAYNSPDCYSCHPTGEKGLYVDHDPQYFPIYSGTHNNEWNNCSACHTTSIDKTVFTCLTCHQKTESDVDHVGITGYAYNSDDCYLCHPTGEKGQFIDHDPLYFPIFSGTHNNEWDNCNVCHSNLSNRTIVDCLSCHLTNETNNMHGSMNGYSYTSPSCISCHPTGLKGTFTSHDPEFFPIFSGAHNNEWNDCVDCHTTSNTRLTFSCFLCHSKTKMDDKHLGKEDGYAYDSDLCYSCHPNGKD